MTLQRRIGVVFFILAFITAVANIIFIEREYSSANIILCTFLMISFGYSIFRDSHAAKILQIGSFLVTSGLSFSHNDTLIFGSAILIVEVFVLYAYDFYQSHPHIKIISTGILLALFIFSAVTPFEVAAMWVIFTGFVIVAIFMILYEKLRKAYNAISESENIASRAMDLVERVSRAAKDK